MSKIKVEVKLAEPAAPVKWEFPCFARHAGGALLWAHNGNGRWLSGVLASGSLSGVWVSDGPRAAGYSAFSWDRKEWMPVPKEESKHWRVVIDASGVRLEKEPAAAAAPEREWEFPCLVRGREGTGNKGLMALRLDGETALTAGATWGEPEGDVISTGITVEDYDPCPGSATVTNRPGVEFPRLYAMGGNRGSVAMRVAPGAWWIVENGTLRPGISDDAIRLRTEPKDTPLPDGSSMTLTFT